MLSRTDLLHQTEQGRTVFAHYLGRAPKPGRNFQNPLPGVSKQATPSFNVYPHPETGEWFFKDFATDDGGSCFDLVMRLYGLDFVEVLPRIATDLSLVGSVPDQQPGRPAAARRPTQKPPVVLAATATPRPFQPSYRESFTIEELAFWQQSGITPEKLHKYGVRALKSYAATDARGKSYTVYAAPNCPLFAYEVPTHPGFVKVYAPLSDKKSKFRWPTGQPPGYVFGLAQLPDWSPCIVLAAGEKDALTLSTNGYPAVTVGSESAPVSAELVAALHERCDEVLVLYDADDTGRREAQEISQQHGIRWAELPAELAPYGKDATDFYRAVYAHHLDASLLMHALREAHSAPAPAPPAPAAEQATRIRTAAQCFLDARNAPPLRKLFGCLWETPGIAILAGDTGIGKSVLAVHIGHLVSSAQTELLELRCAVELPVLYYDFELTDRQFEKRFDGFPFTNHFLRADFNPKAEDVEVFTFNQIGADLDRTGAQVVILDNITALAVKTTADADVSIHIMKGLKRLQNERGISSLILAHTPKLPQGAPLTLNHLAGSKLLSNFADSVIFLGRSIQGSGIRYLKQVKNRTDEELSGVLVCELGTETGHLGFTLLGPDEEKNHLAAQVETSARPPRKAPLAEVSELLPDLLHEPQPAGKLGDRLAAHFDTTTRTIADRLAELRNSGAGILSRNGTLCYLVQEDDGREKKYMLRPITQVL